MTPYKYHVFFCTNNREDGSACCECHGATGIYQYARDKFQVLKKEIPEKVRINRAGCLNRCDSGPVIVIYPEATWYSYVDKDDIDEIIESHLKKGQIVERLLIDNAL